jgi:hypothetical protein
MHYKTKNKVKSAVNLYTAELEFANTMALINADGKLDEQ